MYDIIKNILDHTWQTNTSEQQYIYTICGVVIIVMVVTVIDLTVNIFKSLVRR